MRCSANLLVRYIDQGRADPERAAPSPRRLVCWIMSRPDDLPGHVAPPPGGPDLLPGPEMTTLATRVREFATILTRRRGQELDEWIAKARVDALPGFDSYLNGLEKDHDERHRRLDPAAQQRPHRGGPTPKSS
jgi:hypothetical protein